MTNKLKPLSVEDRFAIEDLCARYAWTLDTGDPDGFAECFTPDALMMEEVFDDPDIWRGRDQIRRCAEHYKNVPNFPGRQHHLSQLMLDGNSEECAARILCLRHRMPGQSALYPALRRLLRGQARQARRPMVFQGASRAALGGTGAQGLSRSVGRAARAPAPAGARHQKIAVVTSGNTTIVMILCLRLAESRR